MLMDLKQPVQAGQTVPITLVFEDGARQRFSQTVQAPVQALGAAPASPAGHGGHGMKH
jgi:periplasmic copper chaperone A